MLNVSTRTLKAEAGGEARVTEGTPSSRWAAPKNSIENEYWTIGLLESTTWSYARSGFVQDGLRQELRTHSIHTLLTQTHTAPGGSSY